MKRFILAMLAALAFHTQPTKAQTPAPAMMDVTVGTIHASDHVVLFAGIERGVFAKYGLDPKMVFYPTGVEMLTAMVAGQNDVGLLGSAPFLAAAANGAPVVLIGHLHGDATKKIYSDAHSIVASGASGIRAGDIAALKGRKIGYAFGTVSDALIAGVLKNIGSDLSAIRAVNLPPSNLPTALRTGDVDAIVTWEPWATVAVHTVPGAVRVSHGQCVTCYDVGTIITTRKAIANKAEMLRRFTLAFAESQQWLRSHFNEAAEINMHYIQGVDLDVMKEALIQETYDMRVSRNVVDAYNNNLIPLMLKEGRIPKAFDAANVVDPQFYLYALKTAPQLFSDLKPIPDDVQFK